MFPFQHVSLFCCVWRVCFFLRHKNPAKIEPPKQRPPKPDFERPNEPSWRSSCVKPSKRRHRSGVVAVAVAYCRGGLEISKRSKWFIWILRVSPFFVGNVCFQIWLRNDFEGFDSASPNKISQSQRLFFQHPLKEAEDMEATEDEKKAPSYVWGYTNFLQLWGLAFRNIGWGHV